MCLVINCTQSPLLGSITDTLVNTCDTLVIRTRKSVPITNNEENNSH